MALIVQKYGGTSVGSSERILAVAKRVSRYCAQGHRVVVVVSAMSGETNRLIALARDIQQEPDPRELDVVLATGEQVAIGLTAMLTDFISGLGLSKFEMLLAIVVFYLILGCFMETLSMMITTIPIVAPVMFGLGFDPLWFGVVLVILIEMALITPPVGLNLFVVQSLRTHGTLNDVMIGSLPFVVAMLVMIALLGFFPGIALWLPGVVG